MSVNCFFFFFKQKTAYEMRISDWSSDLCSSDLGKGWQLHLTNESPEGWLVPGQNPFGLYLYTDRVAELAERMRDAILEREKAPTHKPWGMYEFSLPDPDETPVRIGWPSRLVG